MAANDESWAEDAAVVVEFMSAIEEEEKARIAENVWQTVFYIVGLKAVLQGVFVSTLVFSVDFGRLYTGLVGEILGSQTY